MKFDLSVKHNRMALPYATDSLLQTKCKSNTKNHISLVVLDFFFFFSLLVVVVVKLFVVYFVFVLIFLFCFCFVFDYVFVVIFFISQVLFAMKSPKVANEIPNSTSVGPINLTPVFCLEWL